MKALLSIITLIVAVSGWGQEDMFNAGNEAYKAERYDEAIEAYNKVIAQDYYSAELYYNLGNAYYRINEIGESIWAYEVALKLDPGFEYAKSNLTFVNAQTKDKIDSHHPGLGSWFKELLFGQQINLWAWVSVFSAFCLAVFILLFFRTTKRSGRNMAIFGSTLTGLLLSFSLITAWMHKDSITDRSNGIMINSTTSIRMAPVESSTQSFELGEGARVNLLEEEGDWRQIEVNGNTGWILKSEVWEI